MARRTRGTGPNRFATCTICEKSVKFTNPQAASTARNKPNYRCRECYKADQAAKAAAHSIRKPGKPVSYGGKTYISISDMGRQLSIAPNTLFSIRSRTDTDTEFNAEVTRILRKKLQKLGIKNV